MRFSLKDYQQGATSDLVKALRKATAEIDADPTEHWAIALSAPTGAGKTVIASAVIETLFDGSGDMAEDPRATILWVTDDPALNEQTKRKMLQASSTLKPGRLVTIDSSFDQERFDSGRVYFLNIQKLARTNPLSRSNAESREYSLWQTIANTVIDDPGHFYVVIDEAHRGMQTNGERATIVSRIINGQERLNRPAPIVWGISATPERFLQAIRRWETQRTHRSIAVSLDDVRASGLLKDRIILDNPAEGYRESDTTLVRAAVSQTLRLQDEWESYTLSQDESIVLPALVVQVANRPADSELTELLDAIHDSWPGLRDSNIVNTFGEHTALSVGNRVVQYLAPQDIEDSTDTRVVLCKDAISTGWDCPRAEVLVSLRAAQDYTYIAQLIGRMVRTPLARRVATQHTLNDVHCYLPRFNRAQVQEIVNRFAEGSNDEPPVDVVVDPVRVWRNESIDSNVFRVLESVPSYLVPGRIYKTQMARVHTLATLLAGDKIVENALDHVRRFLNGILDNQKDLLIADGRFEHAMRRLRSIQIERHFALLGAQSIEDLPPISNYSIDLDDKNIDDLFRVARRKLPEGVAQNYWNRLLEQQEADDYDPVEAKAEVAVLALHTDVIDAVEAAAEQQTRTWLSQHFRSISHLSDARRAAYEPVRRQARDSELTAMIAPEGMLVQDRPTSYDRHVLSTEDGQFPCELRDWERKVLSIELGDDRLEGWYRNPTGGLNCVRIPFEAADRDKPMYPDFVLLHKTESGQIVPSVVDPHGFHLSDALPKLRGLSDYAERHGNALSRVESVAELDGVLMVLDHKSAHVRSAVRGASDARGLFETVASHYVG